MAAVAAPTYANINATYRNILVEVNATIPPPLEGRVGAPAHHTYCNAMHTALSRILGYCTLLQGQVNAEKAARKIAENDLEEERKAKQVSDTRLQLLVSNFETLVDDPVGDIAIHTKGGQIRAHSAIVGLWSQPFRFMLESQMQEGINRTISVTTEESLCVREMVRFFYIADADINKATALPLLRLSSMYQIESLRGKCFDYLQDHMEAEHCIPLFYMASMQHESEVTERWNALFQICCNHMRSHRSAVLSSSRSPFKGLDLAFVVTILQETVEAGKLGNLHTDSNKLIGSALLAWAKENWEVNDLPELINFINEEVARDRIQIFVKSSRSMVFLVTRDKKVKDLKRMISCKEAIPTTFQWLVFNGKVLEDDLSLQAYGVQNDSTIQLYIRAGHNVTSLLKAEEQQQEFIDERPELWKNLHDYCLTAIIADFEEQSKCPGFLKLNFGTLSHIIQQDELGVSDEMTVFKALGTWLNVNPSVSQDIHALSRLISFIRFPFMELQTLMDIPKTHPVIGGCTYFKSLLQEALQFQLSQNQPANPHKRNSSDMDDSTTNPRIRTRKFYAQVPNVNMNQLLSCIVSNVVHH